MKLEIIQNTLQLFHTYGIKSLSMNDISHLSGIPVKTLNQYFSNKESLVKTCIKYKISQEEIFKYTDDSLLDLLLNYAEAYPKLYRQINHHCCLDLQKYYHSTYIFLLKTIAHYATHLENKVNKGIEDGYIRKKIAPGLLYVFLQEYFSKLLTISPLYEEYTDTIMTETIIVFARGISTRKGQSYIDKKLKIKA